MIIGQKATDTYTAHCIPFWVNAVDIGVSGSIAKYGTRPTITTETSIYKKQQTDKPKPIPHGRSTWGFFTWKRKKNKKIKCYTNLIRHGSTRTIDLPVMQRMESQRVEDQTSLVLAQQHSTSSAVLATASKPMYAKNRVADPASIPFTP